MVISAGWTPRQVAKKAARPTAGRWQSIDGSQYTEFIRGTAGCVISGTWLRQRQSGASQPGSAGDRRAGQFCRSPIPSPWRPRTNLLLLGDPQLAASGKSGHIPSTPPHYVVATVDGQHTLRQTRLLLRPLVPDAPGGVRAAVSALSYEGRLCSTPGTPMRRLLVSRVHTRGVHHKEQFDRPERGRGDPRRAAAALGSP